MKTTNFKIGEFKTSDSTLATILEKIAAQADDKLMYFNMEGEEIHWREACKMDEKGVNYFYYMWRDEEIVYCQFY